MAGVVHTYLDTFVLPLDGGGGRNEVEVGGGGDVAFNNEHLLCLTAITPIPFAALRDFPPQGGRQVELVLSAQA